MTPIECQSDIASALPPHLVRFERFSGCGHAVVPDAPERAFAVIQEFIWATNVTCLTEVKQQVAQ
jgi:hypothetical protein